MKKLVLIQVFCVLCITGTYAQLTMLNGKVALRGTNPTLGDVQLNIRDGNNNGFCIYDTQWSQNRLKVTGDDYTSMLTAHDDSSIGKTIAFLYNDVFIGPKNKLTEGFVTLNVVQGTNDFSGALSVKAKSAGDYTYIGGISGGSTSFYVTGDGNAYLSGVLFPSDLSLKNSIEPIVNSLDKVIQLQGVSFNYNSLEEGDSDTGSLFEYAKKRTPELTREIFDQIQQEKSRKRIGVIAQDVEKILPELVRTREDGLKAVYYPEIAAVLIEAIKELKAEVDELKGNASLRSAANETETTGIVDPVIAQCKLYQNAPNPFNENTKIKFYIPEKVKAAQLCIYNLQGTQLKQIAVSQRGESSQWISGSELSAGMYLYALIADGKEVDVKRMILTE